MLTLALDTATGVCTVGLVRDGHVLAEYDISVGLTHSEGLMPQLDQMFVRTGIKKEEIDRIAVSIGPGSFTGLRIGLAAAEAMAYAWQCGICGVNTLEAMAYNIPVDGVVLAPVLDAQKGNYYTAFYEWVNGELKEIRPVQMADAEMLINQLKAYAKVLLMGECEKLLKHLLPAGISAAPEQMRLPKASSVALAAEGMEALTGERVFSLRPYYIRKSEAEELWEKKHPVFRLCEEKDLPVVMELDREAFFDPWSLAAWQRELQNPIAVWIVETVANEIVGYAGIWNVAGEAQIMRVAVRKSLRNRGFGLLLTQELIRKARESGAEAVTLEVRESNLAAQKVYERCGFVSNGVRPDYYEDTHEGAVIMWLKKEA